MQCRREVRHSRFNVSVVAVAVVALILRLLTAGHSQVNDERLWSLRTVAFSDALVHFHPAAMSASTAHDLLMPQYPTMPGITTMWLGSIARIIWGIGKPLGFVNPNESFAYSSSALTISQSMVAIATALLIGFLVWVVGRWTAPRVGVLAGIVLATSPFWVALGAWFHTDELTALFGLTGVITLAVTLGVPDREPPTGHPVVWAVASGFLLACTVLTKLTGFGFGIGATVVVCWALFRTIRSRSEGTSRWAASRPIVKLLGTVAGSGIVTIAVLYPALWASPATQLTYLRHAFLISEKPQPVFYHGRTQLGLPGSFYFEALSLRTRTSVALGLLVGIPIAFVRRRTRSRAFLLAITALPLLVVLSDASAKYGRYGLVVLGPLAVMASLAVTPSANRLPRLNRMMPGMIAAYGAIMFIAAISVAPDGMNYFNPLFGGGERAAKTLPIGWGQGGDRAFGIIRRDVESRGLTCDQISIAGVNLIQVYWHPCGGSILPASQADYAIQFGPNSGLSATTRNPDVMPGRRRSGLSAFAASTTPSSGETRQHREPPTGSSGVLRLDPPGSEASAFVGEFRRFV